jgi:hypothetical protein
MEQTLIGDQSRTLETPVETPGPRSLKARTSHVPPDAAAPDQRKVSVGIRQSLRFNQCSKRVYRVIEDLYSKD